MDSQPAVADRPPFRFATLRLLNGNPVGPTCNNPLNTSPASDVRELYKSSVKSYEKMMESEIDLPVYREILTRLQDRIAGIEGCLLDSSCGTGHLLELYHKEFDSKRALVGIDLSPSMIESSRARLGENANVQVGDMRDLSGQDSLSVSAALSFFAVHHLAPNEVQEALHEWARILVVGGQLIVAAWEGSGVVDYGESSNVVALRYSKEELTEWFGGAGLIVDRCWIEEIDEFDMDALYIEGTKM